MSSAETEKVDLQESARDLLGVRLDAAQLEAFDLYARELREWNARFNLTTIIDPLDIQIKHFLDSLSCLKAMGRRPAGRVVDVGTGAGFPGLCLKIACPQLQITLIESVGKKVEFCRHVTRELGLQGVAIQHARAEQLGRQPEHRETYDWALARAVASLPVLAEYLLPFLRIGGRAIAQKGDTAPAEASAASAALSILGGELEQLLPVELPRVAETRYLVVISKTAATPARYPRRSGIPAKRPLS